MNGLFAGTLEGIYLIEPEKSTTCELLNKNIELIETNHNGLAVASIKDEGIFIRNHINHWEKKWNGQVTAIEVTEKDEIIVGIFPTGLIISADRGKSWKESKGIHSYVSISSIESFSSKKNAKRITAITEVAGSIMIAIEEVGILVSHNLGSSWIRSSDGIEKNIKKIIENQSNAESLYAIADDELFITEDFALNWKNFTLINDKLHIKDMIIFSQQFNTELLVLGKKKNNQADRLFFIHKTSESILEINMNKTIQLNDYSCLIKLPHSQDSAFLASEKKIWATHNQGKEWLQIKELNSNILSMAVCF
jgi:hypothetical protein